MLQILRKVFQLNNIEIGKVNYNDIKVTGNEKVEFMSLDLEKLESVHAFIETFKKRNLPLHFLINNAGTITYFLFINEINIDS